MSNSHTWALRHPKVVTTISLIVVAIVLFGGAHIYMKNKVTGFLKAVVETRQLLTESLESRNKALQTFDSTLPKYDLSFSDVEIKDWYSNTDELVNAKTSKMVDPTKEESIALALLVKSEDKVKTSLYDYNLAIKYLNYSVVSFPTNIVARSLGATTKDELKIKKAFLTNF